METQMTENNEQDNGELQERTSTSRRTKTRGKKQKKKIYIVLIFILMIAFISLFGFYIEYKENMSQKTNEKEIIPITSIVISTVESSIEVNNSIEIEKIIEPVNYNVSNLQWVSSNPEIITVENGIVTAIATGESTIYVIDENGIKSNEILIQSIVKVEEIALSKETLEIEIGKTEKLFATIMPENAINKNLIWKTTDGNVANVYEDGTITGINVGECIVSASTTDEKIIDQCKVKVNPIEVSSLTLDEKKVTLGIGQEYILLSTVLPQNATYKNIVWSSSNNSVLTVNEGKIKAISEGEATVTITSKNNKTASCNFTVKTNPPSGTIKYAKDTYNIRSGPNTKYSKLGSVNKNDEVEILKENDGWTKVRISSGTVGYMTSKGYTSTKTYLISNVPYINQFSISYPTGCEAVSATMVARYAGYNINSAQVIAATPTDERGKRQETVTVEIKEEKLNEETGEMEEIITTQEKTDWYGGNPFEVFVGHPSKRLSEGSYGCFAKPITVALKDCGVPAQNISGCSIDTLFNYIANGKPVVVWCKKNAGDLTEGVTWKYEDESGSYTELVGEHCAVLIGYDGEYVYLNDPSAGKNVKQPKAKFISNWHKLFSQAIIIN